MESFVFLHNQTGCIMYFCIIDEVLLAYPLEMLPNSSNISSDVVEAEFGEFKEFIDNKVQFFQIGKYYQKDLLVYARRNTPSVRGSRRLIALEPIESMCDPQSKTRTSHIKRGMFGATYTSGRRDQKFFQIYKVSSWSLALLFHHYVFDDIYMLPVGICCQCTGERYLLLFYKHCCRMQRSIFISGPAEIS